MDILRIKYLESTLFTYIEWAALCQGLVYAENIIWLGEKFNTLKKLTECCQLLSGRLI